MFGLLVFELTDVDCINRFVAAAVGKIYKIRTEKMHFFKSFTFSNGIRLFSTMPV